MAAEFALIAFMVLTLLVVIVGIGFMMRGGKLNDTYSTKLMTARVVLQAAALIVFVIIVLASR